MALPEFQRGYVWNRDQVRALMDSCYRRHPIGSLLVWLTTSEGASFRGDGALPPGVVKLLLDGQQRMTTLYGIIRGKPPRFFDGNPQIFSGLFFHLDREEFSFYMPLKMKDDPLWIDVTKLMQAGIGPFLQILSAKPDWVQKLSMYVNRINDIHQIQNIELHVEEVTGADKSIDVVVNIFNRVNSGGTKLSKGDLALAKVSAEWPDARDQMKSALTKWRQADYCFDLDWLLRNVNTVLTGEAKFKYLHTATSASFKEALKRTEDAIDYLLNLIGGRLGLDHDRVFFGRYAMPVLAHLVDRRGGKLLDVIEQDKALFWYVQSAMWGRFSGQSETFIDQDLSFLEDLEGGLDRLIHQLRLWRGDLQVRPEHFAGWSLGARFYPVLYLLTRVGAARDWGTGLPVKESLFGKKSRLHIHHIFPKAQLYKRKHGKAEVNAIANFCFQTEATNVGLGARLPEEYLSEVEENFPGALVSQWIPMDRVLWKMENYLDFLVARQTLLAATANIFMRNLLHGAEPSLDETKESLLAAPDGITVTSQDQILSRIASEQEDQLILDVSEWVCAQGLPEGCILYEITSAETNKPLALLDLAWPRGLQEGFSEPVALLINEGAETLVAANQAGFRCFTDTNAFKRYVESEVLAQVGEGKGSEYS